MHSRSYANHGRWATRHSRAAAPAVVISLPMSSESLHLHPLRHSHHGDDSVVDGMFEVLGCYPQRVLTEGDEAMLALKTFGIRSSTRAMSHMLPDSAVRPRCFLAWSCDWIGRLSLVSVLSRGMDGPIRLDLVSMPSQTDASHWGPAFVIQRLQMIDVICCKIVWVSPMAEDAQLVSSLPIPPRCETWC